MSAPSRSLCGTVISAGKMSKAVKVRIPKQVHYRFFKKHFASHRDYLVSDPTNSTRLGDVVRIAIAGKLSRQIRHIITEIVTPFGPPIDARPALSITKDSSVDSNSQV